MSESSSPPGTQARCCADWPWLRPCRRLSPTTATAAAAHAARTATPPPPRLPALGIECYAPKMNRHKFGQPIGALTMSAFLAGGRAVTGTGDGDVLVWERPEAAPAPGADDGDHGAPPRY